MAMTSIFWNTNGTGDGASTYTSAQLVEWLRSTFLADPAAQGVLTGVGSSFAVSGTASPITVGSGMAYVYGFPCWDNASTSLNVPKPVVGTTGHRVVLRATWATQQVRVVLKSSTDGIATPPALTQTAGTTWEISLATLTVTTGGVITVTDTRQFAQFNSRVSTAMLEDNAATTSKLVNGAVTQGKLAAGAVTSDKLSDHAVTFSKIADAAVTAEKLAPGSIVGALGYTPLNKAGGAGLGALDITKASAKTSGMHWEAGIQITAPQEEIAGGKRPAIALHRSGHDAIALYYDGGNLLRFRNSSNEDGLLWHTGNDGDGSGLDADRVAGVDIAPLMRRGGDGANWAYPGTTALAPATMRTQVGVSEAATASTSGVIDIAFPTSFAGAPVITANSVTNSAGGIAFDCVIAISNITATGCRLNWKSASNATISRIAISWIAIGPA